MKTTAVLILCILLNFSGFISLQAQEEKKIEVGIIEHLGDTLPLDLVFFNEKNDTVTIGSFIDKPTILSLVYFDCPGICNPLLDGVSEVIENMGLELGKDYKVLTVSFNFHDTPEKAIEKKKNFLRKHSKSHSNNWIYLTGDSANIIKLVDAVGFKYKQVGLDYIHAGVIMILSPKGKITRYLYGTTFLPFDVKMALIEAQKGLARPTINRVIDYCFSYDPEGRKYTLSVTRITATVIIFFAMVLFLYLLIRSKRKRKTIPEKTPDKV